MSVNATENGSVAAATGGPNAGKPTAAPSEVGWLFVPQYYTFLNNDPSKLHCFYSKRSTLVHGAEQEDVPLCIGQQQIHEKIVSLGFSDAKVYVSNVDSQASAAGGIVIQVLGEMSNKGGAWRKFAQTFFLAEQPNGYFVLNDIFRYLKEEEEAEEEAQDVHDAIQSEVQEAEAKAVDVASAPVELSSAAPQAALQESIGAVTDAQSNGILKPQEPTPAEPSEIGMEKKVTAVERDQAPVLSKGEEEAAEAAAQPIPHNEAASTATVNGVAAQNSAAVEQAPEPPAPSGPKTWANLAAANATRWGTTVNTESRGVSAIREQPSAPAARAPAAQNNAAANGAPGRSSGSQPYSSAQVFVKNVVVEHMPAEGLQAALEAKFGPLKECQVVPAKAVAFVEFSTVDAARKAIQLSLPSSQGGEGGIKIGKNGWAIIVEEKRKPGAAGSAGGAASTRTGRGGSGAGAQGGAGRGSGSSRGGRGGNAGRGGRGAAP